MTDYLDIEPETLANPDRLVLAKIEAVMLWPDDADSRERFMQAAGAEFTLDILPHFKDQSVTPAELADFAREIRNIPRIKDLERGEKTKRGIIVGELLWRVVGWHELNPAMAGVQRQKRDIAKRIGVSLPTLEKWWATYRPVAHLWAAYVDALQNNIEAPFPCSLKSLPVFLATAEAYRRKGESTRPAQARETILRPGDAVMLPAGLPLPEIDLAFERV